MASFMLTSAALLNKSEWLASVLSHTYACNSPSPPPPPPPPLSPSHAYSQKRQTPMVHSAHVRGLIRIVVPWWRGTVRLSRGACRREACQRAFKEPRPRKRKQMAAGITPLMDCTCSPRSPLPQLLFNQCPENPLGALKWKNVSMLGLSTQHQITRSLLTPATLPISLTHFHKQASTIHVYGLLCSTVAPHQTSDCQ